MDSCFCLQWIESGEVCRWKAGCQGYVTKRLTLSFPSAPVLHALCQRYLLSRASSPPAWSPGGINTRWRGYPDIKKLAKRVLPGFLLKGYLYFRQPNRYGLKPCYVIQKQLFYLCSLHATVSVREFTSIVWFCVIKHSLPHFAKCFRIHTVARVP